MAAAECDFPDHLHQWEAQIQTQKYFVPTAGEDVACHLLHMCQTLTRCLPAVSVEISISPISLTVNFMWHCRHVRRHCSHLKCRFAPDDINNCLFDHLFAVQHMDLMMHGPMNRCVFTSQDHQKRKQLESCTVCRLVTDTHHRPRPSLYLCLFCWLDRNWTLLHECSITVNIKVHEHRQLTSQNKVKAAFWFQALFPAVVSLKTMRRPCFQCRIL